MTVRIGNHRIPFNQLRRVILSPTAGVTMRVDRLSIIVFVTVSRAFASIRFEHVEITTDLVLNRLTVSIDVMFKYDRRFKVL